MGLVDSVKSAGLFAKIALLLIIIANFFNLIIFTTTSWGIVNAATGNDAHVGLWRRCSKLTTGCNDLDGYANEWVGAVQAFAIFGFVGINVACLLIVLYIFWDSCKSNKEVGMAASIICFVTAGCWLLAVIIFGAEFEDDPNVSGSDDELGYSFGLAIVALLLEAIGGVLLLLEVLKGSSGTSPSS
ncbi:epithelial membrane protein 1 [Aplysia californica]|uniref:Epithelial membrane protein 1 n=1 Tax=Aplysia californica TaxID=6500 RepID=A0ABM0K186_APLCA|nr:epithelial membrane protein 1 [Aplysia californica]